MQISTSEFRKGLRIEIDGTPYRIVDMNHIQQKRRAVIKTKLKNILSGSIAERTFLSGERVEKPDMEEKEMEFLYSDGEFYHFMDSETFEQITIDFNVVEEVVPFLKENEKVAVQFYNGAPISLDLPQFIEVEIAETEPGFKGDTVTSSYKPAKITTGGQVMVPMFIAEGDVVKINTEDYSYIERVKSGGR